MYRLVDVVSMLNERIDEVQIIENYYEDEWHDFTYYFSCPAELVKMVEPSLCYDHEVALTRISLCFRREKEDVPDNGEIETAVIEISPVEMEDTYENEYDWQLWANVPFEIINFFYNLAIKNMSETNGAELQND